MRVFFDVDLTILGQDGTLRPGTRDLFVLLIERGHQVFVWSGFGDRSDDLLRHDICDLVSGFYSKPLTGMAKGYEAWGLPFPPDFVVDDHPGPPSFMGGRNVSPYIDRHLVGDPDEWERVVADIERHVPRHEVPRNG
jgi:hypothetical protein